MQGAAVIFTGKGKASRAITVDNTRMLCYNTKAGRGEMSEWFMELVLKTSDVARHRGFESLSLRQIGQSNLPYLADTEGAASPPVRKEKSIAWRSTQVAVRGSPAKGVGWGDWREGSNPSFSAKTALRRLTRCCFFCSPSVTAYAVPAPPQAVEPFGLRKHCPKAVPVYGESGCE